MEKRGMSAVGAPYAEFAPMRGEFQVNAFTRTKDDGCEISQMVRDSAGPGNYMRTNLVPAPTGAATIMGKEPILLGAEGFGVKPDMIDADSRMRNEATQAGRQRCPLHVQARPFATVPYMGSGRGSADIESVLLHGEFARKDRPCGTISESFLEGQFQPLVPHLAAHIQNPANLVPEVAAKGWIRGGIPARQYIRDLNM
jgi:hypothetical protein